MRLHARLLLTFGATLMGAAAFANDYFASTDAWRYQGSMTKYATLADAQAAQNSLGTFTFAHHDGGLFQGINAPDAYTGGPAYAQSNIMLTAWYYTTEDNTNSLPKDDPAGDRYYSGWGNPNNTNDSFFQLYDDDGSSRSSGTGAWNGTLDTFTVSASGTNAPYSADYSRMWAGGVGGAGEVTHGTFVSYAYSYSVTGLSATYDSGTGWYKDDVNRGTLSGSFTGIFENQSATQPSNNGFYVFNLTLDGGTTWAEQQGNSLLNGDFAPTIFAAPVPEPATLSALGFGALALLRRRKK